MEVIRPVWIILETPGDLGKPVRKPPSLVRIDVAVTLEDAKQQADGGDPWMLGGSLPQKLGKNQRVGHHVTQESLPHITTPR